MGNQASMVNSMADKLFLPADLVLDGIRSPSRSTPTHAQGGRSPGPQASSEPQGANLAATAEADTAGHMLRARSPLRNLGHSSGSSSSSSSGSGNGSQGQTVAGPAKGAAGGGMGILAFEVASAMQRALELWEQLDPTQLAKLRTLLLVGPHCMPACNATLRPDNLARLHCFAEPA